MTAKNLTMKSEQELIHRNHNKEDNFDLRYKNTHFFRPLVPKFAETSIEDCLLNYSGLHSVADNRMWAGQTQWLLDVSFFVFILRTKL
jgi:hypothetical protein